MINFNEHSLEMSIMELFQDEGYLYLNGEQIHRERSEVLLADDLRQYLSNRYAKDGLTATEVDGILLRLKSISGTIYEANKTFCKLRDREDICDNILMEFGIHSDHSHIINGHVPVKIRKGEQPIKANGKLLVIDGGFSRAYQPETGIAGYTLVFHSRALQLVQHEPFESRQKAIEEGKDIKSNTFLVEFNSHRLLVKDTDKGKELQTQIDDLNKLLSAYRLGLIKENS